MAKANVSQADNRETSEILHRKLRQLHAMLLRTYGEEGSNLQAMADELRDDYMWACADVANDCMKLSEGLMGSLYHQTSVTA